MIRPQWKTDLADSRKKAHRERERRNGKSGVGGRVRREEDGGWAEGRVEKEPVAGNKRPGVGGGQRERDAG